MSSTSGVSISGINTTGNSPSVNFNSMGIDTNALITALVQAKQIPNTQRQTQIDTNTKTLADLSTLQTDLAAVVAAAQPLSNPSPSSGALDVFQNKTASLQGSNGTTGSNILGVSATPQAATGSFTLEVDQIAKQDVINATGAFSASTATAIGTAGSLTINGQAVTLTSGMTLQQVADAINSTTANSNVAASIVQISSSDFQLQLQATKTGQAIQLTGDTSSLASLGLYDGTATGASQSSAFSSTATPLSGAGTLVINGVSVAVDNTMTLSGIASAINGASGTGVTASVATLGSGQQSLVLVPNSAGGPLALSDTGGVISALSLTTQAAHAATNQSLSAKMIYNGLTVYRATNTVDDLVSGVDMQLFQSSVGNPVTVTVQPDLTSVQTQIQNFATAYNKLVDFFSAQTTVSYNSDGSLTDQNLLFNDSALRTSYNNVLTSLTNGVLGLGSGAPNNLRSLGLTIDNANHLNVDTNTLQTAMLTNLQQVKNVFAFNGNPSNPELTVVNHPGAVSSSLAGQPITVTISQTDANGVPTAATFQQGSNPAVNATISGGLIEGPTGSAFDGFQVGYTGGAITGSATPFTATITPTQGIADQISQFLTGFLDTTKGPLQAEVNSINSQNTNLQTQITQANLQIQQYQQTLTAQFAASTTAVASYQSMLTSINATFNAWMGSSSSGH